MADNAMRIMVQGTMSGVGKSLLTTALCRIFRQDGLKTAPFKSQNMSLNSFVTVDGLEMSRIQAVQAEAAGIEPDVRMNPVLLKPDSDTKSQLIVNGEVRGNYDASRYYEMKSSLFPEVLSSYYSLAAENDVIVIEGAGSPAEINLREGDIVNMGLAEQVNAPVLLAGDIDRGGVFAQLYGTIALLSVNERQRIAGTVINKFRGDVDLLEPGLKELVRLTNVPMLGIVPWMNIDLDDEDSLSSRFQSKKSDSDKLLEIAIIRLPHISNFTDFLPLENSPFMGMYYVDDIRKLGRPDLVIIPGTKNTLWDLKWLTQKGLSKAIRTLAIEGTPVIGICGGYQMLGDKLIDPYTKNSGVKSDKAKAEESDLRTNKPNQDENNLRENQSKSRENNLRNNNPNLRDNNLRDNSSNSKENNSRDNSRNLRENNSRENNPKESNSREIEAKSNTSESGTVEMRGLGLLPIKTTFTNQKVRRQVNAVIETGPLNGTSVKGYEIHMGKTEGKVRPFLKLSDGREEGAVHGNVFGTYLHGLFDSGEFVERLIQFLARRRGISLDLEKINPIEDRNAYREKQYDLLALAVRRSLDMEKIYHILQES